jgi:D-3-phosphoglycerate dehydrogenase
LSVLGLGKIGVLVANAGIKNGMEVIGYDPFLTEENKQQLDPRVKIIEGLEEAISGANIVSVHIPLNGKTRHIIGKEQIAQMLQGVLINYSRDGICDDAAVLEALDKGTLAAYITDFPTKELVGHKKVLCTPHLGASTEESEENCALMISRQIKNYIDYGVVNNSVNFPNLEAFPDSSIRSRWWLSARMLPT